MQTVLQKRADSLGLRDSLHLDIRLLKHIVTMLEQQCYEESKELA